LKVEYQNQRVLVTGASAGIGRELALQLAPHGLKSLILVARREAELQALAAEVQALDPQLSIHVFAADLTDPLQVEALLELVAQEVGAVDILINNAGLGDYRLFEDSHWERNEQMLRLNIEALTFLTHQLLPPMIALGRGAILNVSSGLGFFFMPGMSVYAATKHYVTAFSEALRVELRGTGVVVSQLCPGPVVTEFAEVAGNGSMLKNAPGGVVIDAAQCAREALQGFARGQAIIVPGAIMRTLTLLGRAIPRPLLRLAFAGARQRLSAEAGSRS
jgi:short-subunit dehydrogenase